MTNDGNGSPQFSIVHLTESAPPKGVESISLDVPSESVGEVYKAAEFLDRFEFDGKLLIRLGSSGAFGSMLLDLESGQVFEFVPGAESLTFVNSSMEKFSACIEEFVGGFPFYESSDDEGAAEVAACRLEESVQRIDYDSYYEGGFWYELRWSIAIGDFAAEDLLG